MKKNMLFFAAITFLFINIYAFCEAATLKVAVLPFKINSKSDYAFLQDGMQDMLGSRLSWEDKIIVLEKDIVNKAFKAKSNFSGKGKALLIGGKLKADYIVYGSLTILGESASIDAKIIDIASQNEPISFFKQIQDTSQIIPEINRFANDINTKVFNRKSFGLTENKAKFSVKQKIQSNNNFVVMQTPDSTLNQQQFWRSRVFKGAIVGMDFGDVNNDGKTEIVLISKHAVHIFQYVNNRLIEIAKIAQNKINTYIAVDVGDINKNKTAEIFVTSLVAAKNKLSSFVIEFDGSNYKKILEGSQNYYRVVKSIDGKKILLSQKQEHKRGDIYSSPVSTMISEGLRYNTEKLLAASGKINALGAVYDSIYNQTKKNLVAFDKQDYINIFNSANSHSFKGADKLGGNMSRFFVKPKDPSNNPLPQYFPMRLRTADINKDGKAEILSASNHDLARSMIKGFRSFSKSHIQAMVWDDLGLKTIWKTRKFNGRVSDFFINDFDNDKTLELVACIVEKENLLVFSDTKSYIVAYDLTLENN